jgi:hypothetical protein
LIRGSIRSLPVFGLSRVSLFKLTAKVAQVHFEVKRKDVEEVSESTGKTKVQGYLLFIRYLVF